MTSHGKSLDSRLLARKLPVALESPGKHGPDSVFEPPAAIKGGRCSLTSRVDLWLPSGPGPGSRQVGDRSPHQQAGLQGLMVSWLILDLRHLAS